MRRTIVPFAMCVALLGFAAPAEAATAPASSVKLNEVSCESDAVEIVNLHSTLTADLSGWRLSDDGPAVAGGYLLPGSTRLAPRAVLSIPLDTHGLKITCDADDLYLFDRTNALVDRVVVPNLTEGYTWSRVGSSWTAGVPTLGGPNAAVPSDAVIDAAAWMFDPTVEVRIDITIAPADMDKLVADPETYVPATFRAVNLLGQMLPATGPLTVGVRCKGNVGSRTSAVYGPGGLDIVNDKVGLKIKFNHVVKGQTFAGLKKLTLNNMVQDPTMTHEVLAYKYFRANGVYAPRTGFANVYLNGTLRGLFLNVETYDEIALAWWTQNLAHAYEGEAAPTDAGGTTWIPSEVTVANAAKGFQVDVGDEDDRTDFVALATALTEGTGLSATARKLLDVDEVARYLAVEKYVNHWDGYSGTSDYSPKNFYLLSDRWGRFQMSPWGTDQAWAEHLGFLKELGHVEPFDSAKGVIFTRCLADDYCASVYKRTLANLATQAKNVADEAYLLMVQHSHSRIADTVRLADEPLVLASFERTKTVMTARPQAVADYLAKAATGLIRWQPSTLIVRKGKPLTAAHLNAYTDVPGTFRYSVAVGRVLKPGRYRVTAFFTPTDPLRMGSSKVLTFTVR